jgi:hypothetical protein
VLFAGPAGAQISQELLDSISTPNQVETSIGTLKFLDGAPLPETAEKAYDYLDTARAADAFLKGIPGCSVLSLIEGAHSISAVEAHEVMIFDKLMDPKSLCRSQCVLQRRRRHDHEHRRAPISTTPTRRSLRPWPSQRRAPDRGDERLAPNLNVQRSGVLAAAYGGWDCLGAISVAVDGVAA